MKIGLQSYRKMLAGTRSSEETGLIYNSCPVQKSCKRCKWGTIFGGFVFFWFLNCLVFLIWLFFCFAFFFFPLQKLLCVLLHMLTSRLFLFVIKGIQLGLSSFAIWENSSIKAVRLIFTVNHFFHYKLVNGTTLQRCTHLLIMYFKNLIAFNGTKQNM